MHALVAIVLIIGFYSTMALGFSMDPEKLDQSVRKYLSIYNNYQIDENIDEDVVEDFVEFIHQNSDVYNYVAEVQTEPEFAGYLEKYSNLKLRHIGRPIEPDIKVLFSTTPLTNYANYGALAGDMGIADTFTRVVFIDRGYWNYYQNSSKFRETLLFHELGHVDLYRQDIVIWSDKKVFYSFMSHFLLPFIVSPEPIDPNETFYKNNPKKIAEILGLRAAIESLFQILYEELFSEENTLHRCYPRVISLNCSLTQREAFSRYTRSLSRIKSMTIGPTL